MSTLPLSANAVHFAFGSCELGTLLAARSSRGICAILLGDSPEVLLHELQSRFPQAQLTAAGADFEQQLASIARLIETPADGFDLPLDVRGSVFQERVWAALQQIPAGTTVSYSQLASRIGAPNAVRAVASACAANCLAVAIPCHRVVRQDGSLSGYRWGIARKRQLLEREAR